jgi:hypothetical protein
MRLNEATTRRLSETNSGRLFADHSPSIRDDWDKVEAQYTYDFIVLPR